LDWRKKNLYMALLVARGATIQNVKKSPWSLFGDWYAEELQRYNDESVSVPMPFAMTLATASSDGVPSARQVLMKAFDECKGVCWFTNYRSRKARELDENPRAALVFWWPHCDRSVRIEGDVNRATRDEAREYFATRPKASQLAAVASSSQSSAIERDDLLTRYEELAERYRGDDAVPECPDYWGGFWLKPRSFEFFQGTSCRLHDRVRYIHNNDGESTTWTIDRLSP
jgi:pyridoxamine 5'-phosphate oxidase